MKLPFCPSCEVKCELQNRVSTMDNIYMKKSGAKTKGTTYVTTRPCSKLWLVEGCPHMNPSSPLHQPQLAM